MDLNRTLAPETVSRLKGLPLKARLILEGSLAGRHLSPFHGFSAEFSQYKRYVPGDDLKFLDWKIFGRRDQLVSRQFRDETNANVYLVLDTSASMGYREGAMSKLEYACALAGAVALLAFRQRDAVALAAGGDSPESFLPPKNGGAHLRLVFQGLEGLTARGLTDLKGLMERSALRMKSHSMVFVFTDLWQEAGAVVAGMKSIRSRKQELTLVQLLTPTETEFLNHGNVELEDMETGARERISARHLKGRYLELLEAHRRRLSRESFNLNARMAGISTGEPFYRALRSILSAKAPLARIP